MAPVPAATVVLLRQHPEFEVFLVRRHRASTFMSNAWVFPGGKVDAADGSAEVAAVRELFEEAGVLIADPPLAPETRAEWRRRLNAGETSFADFLAANRLTPRTGDLHWWANWITPSMEPKRFDAQFFLAALPDGEDPSYDRKETTEGLWISPGQALQRHAEGTLRLPPPQLITLHDLDNLGSIGAAVAAAGERSVRRERILPRFAELPGQAMALLLPWDPEYHTLGQGEALAIPEVIPERKPSRILLQGMTWRMM